MCSNTCKTFLYVNEDTCEIGFQLLFVLYCGDGAGGNFGRMYKRYGHTMPLSQCFTLSNGWGRMGWIIPMVIVVERGDVTGAFGLFKILMTYGQFHYVMLCIS